MPIHPLAFVHPSAQLAGDVAVGPFAYIGPDVILGAGCILHHHAQIEGHTTAGEANEFFPNAVIGAQAQDLKYRGSPCRLVIGSHNKFRENCTVHLGTEDGGAVTRIGDHNLIMVAAHIAHDCQVGSHVVLSNNVLLAGHVVVEDWVVLSGGAGSHHFVTFGQHSFVGGLAGVTKDVPPYMIVDGHPASVRGVNFRGLKRRGFTEAQIDSLKMAYRLLYKDLTPLATQTAELERLYPECHEIRMLLASLRNSIRGKFGRYRESLRGKIAASSEDEDPPPHVSGH